MKHCWLISPFQTNFPLKIRIYFIIYYSHREKQAKHVKIILKFGADVLDGQRDMMAVNQINN